MKSLLMIADHPAVVQAIRTALRQTTGFRVLGSLDGRRSARASLAELQPDALIIDQMEMPGAALARIREAAEVAPASKRILLGARMDDEALQEAFTAGATAVVSRTVHPLTLGTLLREVVRGNVVHRPEHRSDARSEALLTTRELQILQLTARGWTNGRIARELWVTEQTVKFHLSNTYRKLGVTNRTQASHYAYTRGLLDADDLAQSAGSAVPAVIAA